MINCPAHDYGLYLTDEWIKISVCSYTMQFMQLQWKKKSIISLLCQRRKQPWNPLWCIMEQNWFGSSWVSWNKAYIEINQSIYLFFIVILQQRLWLISLVYAVRAYSHHNLTAAAKNMHIHTLATPPPTPSAEMFQFFQLKHRVHSIFCF